MRLWSSRRRNPSLPSGPKKAPHWAQKKCSGCQVLSRAVTTFCGHQEESNHQHADVVCAAATMGGCGSGKAGRGQPQSTAAAGEALECRDRDIIFSRLDSNFVSLVQSLWTVARTRGTTSPRGCQALRGSSSCCSKNKRHMTAARSRRSSQSDSGEISEIYEHRSGAK